MGINLSQLSAKLSRRAPRARGGVSVHEDDAGNTFELVEAARAGDRSAFAVLFDRFHPPVFRMAMARLGSAHDAEDVVGETFLRAWKALPTFEWTGAPFGSWLVAIAHSQIKQLYRTRSRKPATAMAQVPEPVPSDAFTTHDHADLRIEVHGMLSALPEKQRTVLTLRFYGGLSAQEIGEQIGASPESVRQIQLRALERLAQLARKERAA